MLDYVNFSENEPNHVDKEDCIEMYGIGYKWNDQNCGREKLTICQKELIKPIDYKDFNQLKHELSVQINYLKEFKSSLDQNSKLINALKFNMELSDVYDHLLSIKDNIESTNLIMIENEKILNEILENEHDFENGLNNDPKKLNISSVQEIVSNNNNINSIENDVIFNHENQAYISSQKIENLINGTGLKLQSVNDKLESINLVLNENGKLLNETVNYRQDIKDILNNFFSIMKILIK